MRADQTCDLCRFFDPESDQCRRYAPRPVAKLRPVDIKIGAEDPGGYAVWPEVIPEHDWCGEFERAPAQA